MAGGTQRSGGLSEQITVYSVSTPCTFLWKKELQDSHQGHIPEDTFKSKQKDKNQTEKKNNKKWTTLGSIHLLTANSTTENAFSN